MELKLTIRDGSVFRTLTEDQVTELIDNIYVSLPTGNRIVSFSQKEPLDVCNYWQPTNGCGDPVGNIREFDTSTQTWV